MRAGEVGWHREMLMLINRPYNKIKNIDFIVGAIYY